jgi:hypothetical protein
VHVEQLSLFEALEIYLELDFEDKALQKTVQFIRNSRIPIVELQCGKQVLFDYVRNDNHDLGADVRMFNGDALVLLANFTE